VSDEDPNAPDFAMLRAVEILANIYERARKQADVPPPPSDKPIVLFSEGLQFAVGVTTRADVEKQFGVAFAYPAKGWHTYCVRGTRGERLFLSAFYADGTLASAELYAPQVDRAPRLEARNITFRFVPGEVAVGAPLQSLPEHFGRMPVPSNLGPYADMFEARFPGGAAYAMGNEGTIERLALYVFDELDEG
jgi:hypothetical protein